MPVYDHKKCLQFIRPKLRPVIKFVTFLQGCQERLPDKAAGQGCRARLPGKAAGQGCRATTTTKQNLDPRCTNAGKKLQLEFVYFQELFIN
jgi:hypothetical protein